ncbi:hypothetical protein QQ054_09330 [Oscillatoria amoena NRMC-F 0135]|nr:hypothetical protein [Oscillatoria amoena NRMC-F 0135]
MRFPDGSGQAVVHPFPGRPVVTRALQQFIPVEGGAPGRPTFSTFLFRRAGTPSGKRGDPDAASGRSPIIRSSSPPCDFCAFLWQMIFLRVNPVGVVYNGGV